MDLVALEIVPHRFSTILGNELEATMKNRLSLRNGILADESGQDTVEYLIMATVVLGLGLIIYFALRNVLNKRSSQIDSKWPNP